MYVKEIKLAHFRNYEEQAVQFHPGINLITGSNAQGKTNLLESLYIMSIGKSFRTNRDKDMIGFNKPWCSVKSLSANENGETEIEIMYSQEGKAIKIDGVKNQKNIDLLEHIYMVVFSPDDLKIVKDEPEKRRKFLDRELCQIKPVYYRNLGRYKKILQNRNTLLKQGEVEADVLAVWDEGLADYGSRIMLERAAFIKKLGEISKELCLQITNHKETLTLSYESSVSVGKDLAEQKEIFLAALQKSRRQDLFRGNSSVGPHKDDLKIMIDEVDIRNFGSQGQQRTAALSLKLAEIDLIRRETGEDAILLLDDVLSELDLERQGFLIHRLKGIQIFITATEISGLLMENLEEGYVFQVEKGTVARVDDATGKCQKS